MKTTFSKFLYIFNRVERSSFFDLFVCWRIWSILLIDRLIIIVNYFSVPGRAPFVSSEPMFRRSSLPVFFIQSWSGFELKRHTSEVWWSSTYEFTRNCLKCVFLRRIQVCCIEMETVIKVSTLIGQWNVVILSSGSATDINTSKNMISLKLRKVK